MQKDRRRVRRPSEAVLGLRGGVTEGSIGEYVAVKAWVSEGKWLRRKHQWLVLMQFLGHGVQNKVATSQTA